MVQKPPVVRHIGGGMCIPSTLPTWVPVCSSLTAMQWWTLPGWHGLSHSLVGALNCTREVYWTIVATCAASRHVQAPWNWVACHFSPKQPSSSSSRRNSLPTTPSRNSLLPSPYTPPPKTLTPLATFLYFTHSRSHFAWQEYNPYPSWLHDMLVWIGELLCNAITLYRRTYTLHTRGRVGAILSLLEIHTSGDWMTLWVGVRCVFRYNHRPWKANPLCRYWDMTCGISERRQSITITDNKHMNNKKKNK